MPRCKSPNNSARSTRCFRAGSTLASAGRRARTGGWQWRCGMPTRMPFRVRWSNCRPSLPATPGWALPPCPARGPSPRCGSWAPAPMALSWPRCSACPMASLRISPRRCLTRRLPPIAGCSAPRPSCRSRMSWSAATCLRPTPWRRPGSSPPRPSRASWPCAPGRPPAAYPRHKRAITSACPRYNAPCSTRFSAVQ